MKDWEKYESQIFEKLRIDFPNSHIKKDQKLQGKFSMIKRQIDILVKGKEIGKDVTIVIDCKKFSRKVNVKHVESFIGFLEDVKAHIGVLVTNKGYSKAAVRRAENSPRDVKLDIVNYVDFDSYEFDLDFENCQDCISSERAYSSYLGTWHDLTINYDGKPYRIQTSECNYCGVEHIKCYECGEVISETEADLKPCQCGLKFGHKMLSSDGSEYEIIIENIE